MKPRARLSELWWADLNQGYTTSQILSGTVGQSSMASDLTTRGQQNNVGTSINSDQQLIAHYMVLIKYSRSPQQAIGRLMKTSLTIGTKWAASNTPRPVQRQIVSRSGGPTKTLYSAPVLCTVTKRATAISSAGLDCWSKTPLPINAAF